MGAKPPILEFLRIVRRTSVFGVFTIITDIFKTTQKLRFWSFCGGRKNLRFWSFCDIVRRTSVFGVLKIIITDIFKTTQKTLILEFLRWAQKTSDFGGFAYSTQKLRFWSIKNYYY